MVATGDGWGGRGRADSANDPVRVAACQVSLAIGEVARNRSAALEAAGLAADRGAAIIGLPELTPCKRPVVVANVQAAAFANRMFIAAACRCGPERGVSWVGGSIIAGPDGYPLAGPASRDNPEILIADCELALARVKAISARNNAHADRRPDLYR